MYDFFSSVHFCITLDRKGSKPLCFGVGACSSRRLLEFYYDFVDEIKYAELTTHDLVFGLLIDEREAIPVSIL